MVTPNIDSRVTGFFPPLHVKMCIRSCMPAKSAM